MRISPGKLAWFVAPLFGLAAIVLPVMISPPSRWYEAPLFPVLRNAPEHLGLAQLVLLFGVGVVLGVLNSRRPWLLGLTAVTILPAAASLKRQSMLQVTTCYPSNCCSTRFTAPLHHLGIADLSVEPRLTRRVPVQGACGSDNAIWWLLSQCRRRDRVELREYAGV